MPLKAFECSKPGTIEIGFYFVSSVFHGPLTTNHDHFKPRYTNYCIPPSEIKYYPTYAF